MMKILCLVSLLFYSSLSFSETVFFERAEWAVEGIHFPGIVHHKPTGRSFPVPRRKVNRGQLIVNEHMDRFTIKNAQRDMVFKRACVDDVSLDQIPDVDFDSITKDLTVWTHESSHSGGYFRSTLFEQKGEGVLVGTHHSENEEAIIKTQFTVAPIQGVPAPPPADNPDDEPTPNVPREEGKRAVVNKLAVEMDLDLNVMADYVFTGVVNESDLQVKVWLDAHDRALLAEREVKDPCDPRYGDMEPARWLYVFTIRRDEDPNGEYYHIQTKLVDVETGVTEDSFSPDFTGRTGNIDAEVSNSYDQLGWNIQRPEL